MGTNKISEEGVAGVCGAIANLVSGHSNLDLFGTPSIRKVIYRAHDQFMGDSGATAIVSAIRNLANTRHNRRLLGTAKIKEALQWIRPFCSSTQCVHAWTASIHNLCLLPANRKLYGAHDMIQHYTLIAKEIKDHIAAEPFVAMMFAVLHDHKKGQEALGTLIVRNALLRVVEHIHDQKVVATFAQILQLLLQHGEAAKAFNTVQVREALQKLREKTPRGSEARKEIGEANKLLQEPLEDDPRDFLVPEQETVPTGVPESEWMDKGDYTIPPPGAPMPAKPGSYN
jgi:hypothetical protein